MIVSCPGCTREYRIDESAVQWVGIPDSHDQGVKLLCTKCDDAWWEKKPVLKKKKAKKVIHLNNFDDKTDLGLMVTDYHDHISHANSEQKKEILHNNQSRDIPTNNSNLQHSQSAAFLSADSGPVKKVPSMNMAPPTNQGMDSLAGSAGRSKPNDAVDKNKFPYGWFVFFLVLVVSAGAIGAFFFKDQLFRREPIVTKSTVKDFVVQNVHYDVRTINNEKIVTVVGEIGNPNNIDVPVPALEILLLGPCVSKVDSGVGGEEISNKVNNIPESGQLCTVYSWPYRWEFEHIRAGEKILFETNGRVSEGVTISRVDIDLK